MTELSAGDFLYQSDQELFLVVMDKTDDGYSFAVHGWREIGDDRVEEYINDNRSKLHRQNDIETLIDEEGDKDVEMKFNKLKQLFSVYEQADIPVEGPHRDFTLEEK